MSNKYNITGINKLQLAINLGIGYDKLIRYRHSDLQTFNEYKDFVENYVYGPDGESEGYKLATMSGQPILDRYAELTYEDNTQGQRSWKILLETLIISVERTKDIVKNSVLGLEGTVKEYVNNGDNIITITGTIAGDNKYLYPEDLLFDFIEICNIPDAIEINNNYLNRFWNINSIVIESFTFAQSEKFSNVILYTLNCISDTTTNKIITS